jgi:hypothetical protein
MTAADMCLLAGGTLAAFASLAALVTSAQAALHSRCFNA